MCTKTQKKLCNNDECLICKNRSFESYEKAKFWSDKNGLTKPRQVFKHSHKDKYWFNCDKCGHEFESFLHHITGKNRNSWCPFCANQKLCEKEDCKNCYEKSFES